MRRSQRDHSVPKGAEFVQPIGKPISQDTNRGLSIRWHSPPCLHVVGEGRPDVGHCRTARSVKLVPGCAADPGKTRDPDAFESPAVAVGQTPKALSSVRSADIVRSEHTPLRIEPERGKVGEDLVEPEREMSRDVFKEDRFGLDFADDSGDVRPKVSGVFLTAPTAGDAEWLARVTGSDEIHSTAPRRAVEGAEIIPNRRAIEGRVTHPRNEDGGREFVTLDVADGSACAVRCEPDAKLKPADSGT